MDSKQQAKWEVRRKMAKSLFSRAAQKQLSLKDMKEIVEELLQDIQSCMHAPPHS